MRSIVKMQWTEDNFPFDEFAKYMDELWEINQWSALAKDDSALHIYHNMIQLYHKKVFNQPRHHDVLEYNEKIVETAIELLSDRWKDQLRVVMTRSKPITLS